MRTGYTVNVTDPDGTGAVVQSGAKHHARRRARPQRRWSPAAGVWQPDVVRVFVLGGTGAIGRHAVPALVAGGHEVTALARAADKAADLRRQGATPTEVSMFDPARLASAFAGHDAVVNLATAMPTSARFALRSAHAANRRVRMEGSAAVVDAALQAGVARLLQESVSMVYADGGDGWLDESSPVDHYWLAEANLAAEASARRFTAGGGSATVLRFGFFYGEGATHAEEALAAARHGIVLQLGPSRSYLSSIHVADGAAAVVAALHGPGPVYNVVDDEPLRWGVYSRALAAATGRRAILRVPAGLGVLAGDRLTSLTRSLRVSNWALRTDTAWAPRFPSAREGWAAMARSS